MKLPTLRNRGVEKLVGESPSTAVAEFNAVQATTQKALALGAQVVEERSKFETQQVDNDYESAMFDYNENEGTQEHFDSEQIGTDTDVNRIAYYAGENNEEAEVDRKRIPAYEVYPDMYKDKAMAEIQSRSQNVPRAYRAEWVQDKQIQLEERHSKLTVEASKQQKQYFRDTQTEQFNDRMLKRDYEGAVRQAQQFNGTDLERKQMMDGAYKMREFDGYDDQLAEKQLPELRESLAYLRQPNEDYMAQGGKLDAQERKAQAAEIETAIGSITTSRGTGMKAEDKRLHRDIKTTISGLEQGRPVDAEQLTSILERSEQAFIRDPDGFVIDRDALMETVKLSPSINSIHLAPPLHRQAAIDAAVSHLKGAEKDRALDTLNKAAAAAEAAINKDTIQHGLDSGLLEETPPLDFSNPDSLIAGLELRKHNYDKVTTQWGRSTGYLTDDEANAVSGFLDTATLNTKVQIAGTVSEAMGDRSGEFWEQMASKGHGVMATAGTVASEGDFRSSRAILEGQEILKTDRKILPTTSDYAVEVNSQIGGAYSTAIQRKAVGDSINAAYAKYAAEAGDFSGAFNQDFADAAIQDVTGGLVEIGGRIMEPPVRGMPEAKFDSYIRDVHTDWWREQGGVKGFDSNYKELRSSIRDGRIQLKSIGKNQYALVSHIVDPPETLMNKDDPTQPFVFSHDPDSKKVIRRSGRVANRSGAPRTNE